MPNPKGVARKEHPLSRHVIIRFTPEEAEQLKAAAARDGRSVSGYVRYHILRTLTSVPSIIANLNAWEIK